MQYYLPKHTVKDDISFSILGVRKAHKELLSEVECVFEGLQQGGRCELVTYTIPLDSTEAGDKQLKVQDPIIY